MKSLIHIAVFLWLGMQIASALPPPKPLINSDDAMAKLAAPLPADADESRLATEKNDLADALLAKKHLPEGFGEKFMAMLDDPAQGLIWHNYILQKLDALYLHADASVADREAALARLWSATKSPRTTLAGTALMTLQRLHEKDVSIVDGEELAQRAHTVATDAAFSNSDRLTALHVLAKLGDERALQLARQWLKSSGVSMNLRMTAIAILGDIGDAADMDMIRQLRKHPDIRIRMAVKTALKKRGEE